MFRIIHVTTVHGTYDNRIYSKEYLSLRAEGYDVHLLNANGEMWGSVTAMSGCTPCRVPKGDFIA